MDKVVCNDLRKIFNKHDPMNIYQDDETNFDEYDPEIKEILVVFQKSKNRDNFLVKQMWAINLHMKI